MSSAKAKVKSMIQGLPEDVSLEDIQHHLYVLEGECASSSVWARPMRSSHTPSTMIMLKSAAPRRLERASWYSGEL
jgi:hypothetical protein